MFFAFMEFPKTSSPTGVPSLPPGSGGSFAQSWEHPQSNGQVERMNQELETALCCVTSAEPTEWSSHLPWIEYSHNSHVSAATGLIPFQVSVGYQPSLFPSDEKKAASVSVQHHVRRCRQVWDLTVRVLQRTSEQNRRYADRRRIPAPEYCPGQKVWLAARNVPFKSLSRKLYPSSNLSKPARSALRPSLLHPPGTSRVIQPTGSVGSWPLVDVGGVGNTWSIGLVMVWRIVHGFPGPSSWTRLLFRLFLSSQAGPSGPPGGGR
ncbi:uncharacterized protein LOC124884134 [Girardinichthys multiradiatus]|uniref:uncharacterized protein LOC124884134 n=1 Tax=Girardinichthys multiradiatus TaxID=208333 RepID=UPI001FAD06A7|nr:uncharacterized protein LOC124884134 [Girardinichthys multiradiatus]